MATSLYEQIGGDTALIVLGQLVGVDNPGPLFRSYLREVPPLPKGFTIGQAARAYLAHRLAALESIAARVE